MEAGQQLEIGTALVPLSAATPANIVDVDKLFAGAKLASVQVEFDYWEQVALKLAKACGQKMALSTNSRANYYGARRGWKAKEEEEMEKS